MYSLCAAQSLHLTSDCREWTMEVRRIFCLRSVTLMIRSWPKAQVFPAGCQVVSRSVAEIFVLLLDEAPLHNGTM